MVLSKKFHLVVRAIEKTEIKDPNWIREKGHISMHEMAIFNECLVSLLAKKNKLIIIILPILLMYDILLLVCSLIDYTNNWL